MMRPTSISGAGRNAAHTAPHPLLGAHSLKAHSQLLARKFSIHPSIYGSQLRCPQISASTGESVDGKDERDTYITPTGVYSSEGAQAFQSLNFTDPATHSASSSSAGHQTSKNSKHFPSSNGTINSSSDAFNNAASTSLPRHNPDQDQQSLLLPTQAPPSVSYSSYSEFYKMQHRRQMDSLLPQEDSDVGHAASGPGNGSSAGSSSSNSSSSSASSSSTGTTNGSSVAEALARAQQALDKVESSLDGIDSLPSARPASQAARAMAIARTLVIIGALGSALLASHAFGLVVQWLSAAAGGAAIATWGYKKGSLSTSGAIAAAAVGLGTLGCSLRFGVTLLAFFFSSSKLTQYKEELKASLDDAGKKGGQRDWVQVFCNALVPTVLAIVYGVLAGCVDVPLGPVPSLEPWRAKAVTGLMGAFLGYYACCCGDTWASELGPLSPDTPRLITTLRPVRKGTNGGVTLLGLSASILGGAFIGTMFYATALVSPTLFIFEAQHMMAIEQWKLIPLGLMAGLVGSVLDSLLGATLQYSGYNNVTGRVTSKPGPDVQHISGLSWLSNNAVNAVSASTTAAITALAALKAFGF